MALWRDTLLHQLRNTLWLEKLHADNAADCFVGGCFLGMKKNMIIR